MSYNMGTKAIRQQYDARTVNIFNPRENFHKLANSYSNESKITSSAMK